MDGNEKVSEKVFTALRPCGQVSGCLTIAKGRPAISMYSKNVLSVIVLVGWSHFGRASYNVFANFKVFVARVLFFLHFCPSASFSSASFSFLF